MKSSKILGVFVFLAIGIVTPTFAYPVFTVCDSIVDITSSRYNVYISECNVIWGDNSLDYLAIHGYDIKSKKAQIIAPNRSVFDDFNERYRPFNISGDYVLYSITNPPDVYTKWCNIEVKNKKRETVFSRSMDSSLGSVLYDADISGDVVIWGTKQDKYPSHNDILGYNLKTGEDFLVNEDCGLLIDIAIDSNNVIWISNESVSNEHHEIFHKDLETGGIIKISDSLAVQNYLSISGNIVAWHDNRNNSSDIYGYNLETGQEFEICTAENSQMYPKVSRDIVIWNDTRWRDELGDVLYCYNLADGNGMIVAENIDSANFDIDGEFVVFISDDKVYGINIEMLMAPAIELGKVATGSTVGNDGIDITSRGYKDCIDTWYRFRPQQDGDYVISTCGSSFDTTLTVFDFDLNEIEFNDNSCGKQSRLVLRALAGTDYYIRISGYNNQVGDYKLSIIKDAPEPLKSDLNYDGEVNLNDFSFMADEWLK